MSSKQIDEKDVNYEYWQSVAGIYSAGNIFHLNEKGHVEMKYSGVLKSRRKLNEKLTYANFDVLSNFVDKLNGYVVGWKSTEFAEFCKMTKKEFIVCPNKSASDYWLYSFLRFKVRFMADKKRRKIYAVVHNDDLTISNFFVDRFGGAVQKRDNRFRWVLYDQKKVIAFCSFLLEDRIYFSLLPQEKAFFEGRKQGCLQNLVNAKKDGVPPSNKFIQKTCVYCFIYS